MKRLETRPNIAVEKSHRERRQKQPIGFVDVTPRDGEQQEKKQCKMDVEDRIAVFDQMVTSGITRIEIGHLGNDYDKEYAKKLVPHIRSRSEAGDANYDEVELQVLVSTQEGMVQGAEALEGFDKNRVIIHAYDRSTPNLRGLAKNPYTIQDSADRVARTCLEAMRMGFTRFSMSGEGTVDTDLTVKEAVDEFYLPIVSKLYESGATTVNVNLANTFGSSTDDVGEWSKKGLSRFNRRIKNKFPEVTTSIHTHNDHRTAVINALDAIDSGFDHVEGTMIGMGERAGNVAMVDVMVNLLEKGRAAVEARERNNQKGKIGRILGEARIRRKTIWTNRYVEDHVIHNLSNWHESARAMSETYGVADRFDRTSLGDKAAYAAGSGPHSQAYEVALRDPVNHPVWKNYARIALEHSMLGRPEAVNVVNVDRQQYRDLILKTHAQGGAAGRLIADEIVECDQETREEAIQMAREHTEKIIWTISNPTRGHRTDIFQRRKSRRSRRVDHDAVKGGD